MYLVVESQSGSREFAADVAARVMLNRVVALSTEEASPSRVQLGSPPSSPSVVDGAEHCDLYPGRYHASQSANVSDDGVLADPRGA